MLSPSFDLHDHRQTQNMGPLLAKWRRESPVVRLADGQVYVSRMADCWTVLAEHLGAEPVQVAVPAAPILPHGWTGSRKGG